VTVTMNEIIERLEAEVELIAEWHHSDHANYGLHIKPPHIRAILAALKAGQALADAKPEDFAEYRRLAALGEALKE
jgi:hypothetical protein